MNIEHILKGDAPSLDEYSLLVDLTEKASIELLWTILTKYTDAHWLLKKLIDQNMRIKIPKKNTSDAVDKIINQLSTIHGVSE
jgi:hypothetical protein